MTEHRHAEEPGQRSGLIRPGDDNSQLVSEHGGEHTNANTNTNIDAVVEALDNTSSDPEEHLATLRRRLADEALDRGVLDVAYTTIDTPVGALLLAATETGLVRVAFEREDFDRVIDVLGTRLSPRLLRAPRRLDAAAAQIDAYFAGTRRSFGLPLDYSLSSGFRHTVQRSLSDIAYGDIRSYKEVARLVGNPNAVRAVGTACATNPLPVVVPCHRVLRTDGTLGGYIGGLEAKTALLQWEHARKGLEPA